MNKVLTIDNNVVLYIDVNNVLLTQLCFFDWTYFGVRCSFNLSLINVFPGATTLDLILFPSVITSIHFL